MIGPMPRVLLLLPTSTYRATAFLEAARRLGVEVVVGSEVAPVLDVSGGDRSVTVPLDDPAAATRAIEALDTRHGIDAVVAVDDQGVVIAATAGEALGFPHNPPAAAAATRDKAALRRLLDAGEVPQPRFALVPAAPDPGSTTDAADQVERVVTAAGTLGFPAVVKPVSQSASRGVIRVDSPAEARAAARRVQAVVPGEDLLVEGYVPGVEVAVEGLLTGGRLHVLAVFDKPDPLVGPYFEETLFVTPSRLPGTAQRAATEAVARAAAALGLAEGPVHGEVRVELDPGGGGARDGSGDGDRTARATVIEVAARSIGGLCARTLRFGAGIHLEELILRHALGRSLDGLERERAAAGVMMLPIPGAGTLVEVRGRDAALAEDGIVGLEISIAPGRQVVPLPEGNRYLGFLFARGETPGEVEDALRRAHAKLEVVLT